VFFVEDEVTQSAIADSLADDSILMNVVTHQQDWISSQGLRTLRLVPCGTNSLPTHVLRELEAMTRDGDTRNLLVGAARFEAKKSANPNHGTFEHAAATLSGSSESTSMSKNQKRRQRLQEQQESASSSDEPTASTSAETVAVSSPRVSTVLFPSSVVLSTASRGSDVYGECYQLVGTGRWNIGDRVIYRCSSGPVPLGLSGTILSLQETSAEVMFDREFLGGSTLTDRIGQARGAVLSLNSLLNLTERLSGTPPPRTGSPATEAKKRAQKRKPKASKAKKITTANPFDLLLEDE